MVRCTVSRGVRVELSVGGSFGLGPESMQHRVVPVPTRAASLLRCAYVPVVVSKTVGTLAFRRYFFVKLSLAKMPEVGTLEDVVKSVTVSAGGPIVVYVALQVLGGRRVTASGRVSFRRGAVVSGVLADSVAEVKLTLGHHRLGRIVGGGIG